MNDEMITNDAGDVIAQLREGCTGPNSRCKRDARTKGTFHIIPMHTDPRAENAHLTLPSYHAASRDEAVAMLENGWETAITVDNAIDRDAGYKRRIPVIVLKSGKYI